MPAGAGTSAYASRTGIPADYLRAARRYGPELDPIAQRYRNPVTGRPLSGTALLLKLFKGESGFDMTAVSGAGARGGGQFMPGTRKAVLERSGGKIDPWRSPGEAAQAAVMHLTGRLGHAKGLEGYNPGGGEQYVSYILGQRVGDVGARRGGGRGPGMRRPGQPGRPGIPGTPAQQLPQAGGVDLAGLIANMSGQQQSRPVAGIAPPTFSAGPAFATQPLQAAVAPKPQSGLAEALSSLVGGAGAQASVVPGQPAVPGVAAVPGSTGRRGGRGGGSVFTLAGGYRGTKGVARRLASIGWELGLDTISAKRHNTNPYSGSRSDHDHGNKDAFAYDISNGSRPTPEMDRAAFRIARQLGIKGYKMGQPINQTVQRNGVRVQIIYRGAGAEFGGNHLNHIHIGVKNVRGSGGRDRGVVR